MTATLEKLGANPDNTHTRRAIKQAGDYVADCWFGRSDWSYSRIDYWLSTEPESYQLAFVRYLIDNLGGTNFFENFKTALALKAKFSSTTRPANTEDED